MYSYNLDTLLLRKFNFRFEGNDNRGARQLVLYHICLEKERKATQR